MIELPHVLGRTDTALTRRFAVLLFSLHLVACAAGGSAMEVVDNATIPCQDELTVCDAQCIDLNTDALSCGACGNVCGAGLVCSLGQCSAVCAVGLTQCTNSCVDVNKSAAHCGSCGNPCAVAESCVNGRCLCPAGKDCSAGEDGERDDGDRDDGGRGVGVVRPRDAGTSRDAGPTKKPDAGGMVSVPGGGYIKSGAWKGYAWTAKGGMASIKPADFARVTDFPLCASGKLEPGNANVAMVGWNLNQAGGVNPPVKTVMPALAGIRVAVSNPGKTELRLQVQGAAGGATDRWCAIIPGAGGFIPYGALNTECWAGGKGKPYAGEPLAAALVLVSGREAAPVNFDFCVGDLVEANDDSPPAGAGCSLSGGPGLGTFQLSGDDTASVTRDGRNYRVQNNVWNGPSNEQAVSVEGVSFRVSKQTQERDPRAGAPVSYPSVFIGSNFSRASTGSNLPKQVSALTDVPTAWRWEGASGVYNAAYDVWFSSGAGGDSGTPSAGYLMVWFHDPSEAQPLGSGPSGSAQVAGRSWQVWVGTQNGVPVISYVPNGESIGEWGYDLNDFIQNAMTQFKVVQSSWYLTNIFAGFEIWKQGVGLKTNDFCAIVK